MLNAIKQRIAMWRWHRTVVGQALRHHCYSYFYGDTILRHFSKEAKGKNSAELHLKAMAILSSENPRAAIRAELANYVVTFAELMVCSLKEFEKEGNPAYADTTYISAALYHHINRIADVVDELGRFKFDQPEAEDEDLIYFCNVRSALLLFYANGLNTVRIAIEDDLHSDWYRAYVQAQMVFAEDQIREKIGLPRLLPGLVDGLVYCSFTDYVIAGDPNPLYTFTKTWPEKYLAGHGPKPEGVSADAGAD